MWFKYYSEICTNFTCHRRKKSQFHNSFSTERNISDVIDAKNSDDKNLFFSAAFWLQIIRFIKSILFTWGSRRVIYWSGLFTNTTAPCYEDYDVNSTSSFISQLHRVDAPFSIKHLVVIPLINFNKPTTVSRLISVLREEGRDAKRVFYCRNFR